jgi:hypothetical protein
MKIFIFGLLILLVLIRLEPYLNPPKNDTYYSEFNKLSSIDINNIISMKKITKDNIKKYIDFGEFIINIRLIDVQIKDNKRKIIVYVEHNGDMKVMQLVGNKENYINLLSTSALLKEIKTRYHKIYYYLSIFDIYEHDITNDWYDLRIVLNKYVEDITLDEPIEKNASNQPIRINLLNPVNDIVSDNNDHVNKTPYRESIDYYGVIYKTNQDNTSRTIDEIRKTIQENNIL